MNWRVTCPECDGEVRVHFSTLTWECVICDVTITNADAAPATIATAPRLDLGHECPDPECRGMLVLEWLPAYSSALPRECSVCGAVASVWDWCSCDKCAAIRLEAGAPAERERACPCGDCPPPPAVERLGGGEVLRRLAAVDLRRFAWTGLQGAIGLDGPGAYDCLAEHVRAARAALGEA